MTSLYPANERIKHAYIRRMRDARGMSEASIDQIASAINRFDDYNRHRDFKHFRIDQARGFKHHLLEQKSGRTGAPLSHATVYATLAHLKAFFEWLSDQPGYKSRIKFSDAEYFNMRKKDARIAKATREPRVPTLEQIRYVLESMPTDTVIQRRDRALVACAILTGARDGALASLRLKHIDLDRDLLEHDAREVRTKASKSFPTWFFPVGDDIRKILADWITELRTDHLFAYDDPIFPKTAIAVGPNNKFSAVGITRQFWKNAGAIRAIFKEAFTRAGLPYFNPHSFRNTLAQLGAKVCKTFEEHKAWSQNLGHENLVTTVNSYGTLTRRQQEDIIRSIGALT